MAEAKDSERPSGEPAVEEPPDPAGPAPDTPAAEPSGVWPRSQLRVAVTGGVGAGKSALAAALAEYGAVRIDADRLAREVVAPGTPGLARVASRFGRSVLTTDGSLDRAALARLVFSDPDARAALNEIVHPLVERRSEELMDAAPPDAVIVYEIPLLAETGRADHFDLVIVVEAPLERRLERLAARGVPQADARSRIAAQAGDEERRSLADAIVANDGDRDALAARAGELWPDLLRRQQAKQRPGRGS